MTENEREDWLEEEEEVEGHGRVIDESRASRPLEVDAEAQDDDTPDVEGHGNFFH